MTRVERGRYKGNEWDLIVKPVIEKWGTPCKFCPFREVADSRPGAFVSAYV